MTIPWRRRRQDCAAALAASTISSRDDCTKRVGALAVAALAWLFFLVLYQAFFHFGAPEKFVLIGLEMPFLQLLYDVLAQHFAVLAGVVSAGLSLPLIAVLWRSPWRWAAVAPSVALSLGVVGLLRAPDTLELTDVQGALTVGQILAGTAAFVLLLDVAGGGNRAVSLRLAPRPVVRVLVAVGLGALAFYSGRELLAPSWWADSPARAGYFVLAALLVALLRGTVVEPLIGAGRSSAFLRVVLWIAVVDGFATYRACEILGYHIGSIYPFVVRTEVHLSVFFDALATWCCVALVVVDLVAIRIARGGFEAFDRRFSALESTALLPFVPLDRLLRPWLGPRARFLACWATVWYLPLGVVLWRYHGGFLFFLLGPAVPLALLWGGAVFASQASVVFLRPRSATDAPTATKAPVWRRCVPVATIAVAVLAIVLLPGRVTPWGEIFREYGASERFVAEALAPFARPVGTPHRGLLSRVRQREHSYRVEAATDERALRGYNVVLLTSDALRAESLGCYGYDRDTSPHIDRLARESTVFTRAFAPANHTFTSIGSLLCGDLRHEPIGTYRGTWLAGLLETEALAEALIYNSYMLHLPPTPDVDGIDAVTDYELDERDRLRDDLTRLSPDPFLLWVHNKGTHMKYYFRPSSTDFGSRQIDLYDNNVHYFDDFVGATLGLLDELGLGDRTIVVVSSDHGEHFNEHGIWGHACPSFYDQVIRIPLIVRVPGQSARTIDSPATLTDLGPTLVELLGCSLSSTPEWVVSWRDALLGEDFDAPDRVLPLTAMGFSAVGVMRPDRSVFFVNEREEWYLDHRIDPYERRNLVRLHADRAAEGRRAWREFFLPVAD